MRVAKHALAGVVIVVAAGSAARADSFVAVVGGLTTPVSDDQWEAYAESSPKLGVRLGSAPNRVGGLLMVDWIPTNTDDFGFGNAVDVSAHRFRIQLAAAVDTKVGANAVASFRFGGGLDMAYVHVESNIFGIRSESSETDIGLALEAGAGLWFNVGDMQIGGELALPIGFHDDDDDGDVDLEEYTSVDFDLLFGVRFLSR